MSSDHKIPGYTGFQPAAVKDVKEYPEVPRPNKHIPGYKGYVPEIKSENVYARTFGRTTNDSIEGQISRGFDLQNAERYHSTNQNTYVDQSAQHKARAETNPFLQDMPMNSQDMQQQAGQTLSMTYAEACAASKKQ